MKRNKIKILIAIVSAFILLAIILLPKIKLYFASESFTINKKETVFLIDKKSTLKQLASKLKEEKIIDDEEAFIEIGRYKGLDENKIALGKYVISPSTTIKDLLNGFTINSKGNGNAEVEVTITFNNCKGMYQLDQLSKKVSQTILVDSATLSSYLNDPSTYSKYGFSREQFPAMFIPNTYKVFYDTDEKQFVEKMAKEFKKFWTPERMAKLNEINLSSPSELYTLASMVYLEQSRKEDEWSDISKLYLNRMEINMPL
ncbi:MAG: endolytic transglycosylase MltG, partial [Crocinitomicaceae bacterium]|nr:endolytic transglycosylase MltG [Crocinitomicaceae bacterium]